MPYGISPMVIYYNSELVDFELMEERGLDVPDLDARSQAALDLEEFRAAAEFATRPRRGTAGFYVAADAARARAVHLLRRRRDLRRRRRPDVARVLLRRHPVRARGGAAAAARPAG